MSTIRELDIVHNGLILQVDVTSFYPERPAPYASTPDSPGYDDPGDPGEVEFEITGVSIDCEQTLIESLDWDSEDKELGDLVYKEMSE